MAVLPCQVETRTRFVTARETGEGLLLDVLAALVFFESDDVARC